MEFKANNDKIFHTTKKKKFACNLSKTWSLVYTITETDRRTDGKTDFALAGKRALKRHIIHQVYTNKYFIQRTQTKALKMRNLFKSVYI